MNALIREFANDPGVRSVALLVALDIVLGVAAAFRIGTFRLGWLADFLRADVLFRLFPYFGVWAAVRLGGDFEAAGIGVVEEGTLGVILLSVGSSILNSLRDLGLIRVPDEIAGSSGPPPQP